jgi:hypothetical protein
MILMSWRVLFRPVEVWYGGVRLGSHGKVSSGMV